MDIGLVTRKWTENGWQRAYFVVRTPTSYFSSPQSRTCQVVPGTLLRDVGLQYEYIPLRRRYDSLAQHHSAWSCIEVARDLC